MRISLNKIKFKYNILPYILGVIFLLVYSISTSPITYNFWGSDSAVFQMSGKAMTAGKVMYRDIFDIKGPYLFLIEYLGGCLIRNGRYGIFIFQILNMCMSLYFIARCIDYINVKEQKICRAVSYFLFFFFMVCTFDCGNLTEEYAMPYLFFALLLYLKYRQNGTLKYSALGLGIAFCISAMGRVTNAAFIGSIIMSICIELILKKEWKEILRNATWFIVGNLIAFIPFCIYYGMKNAFKDMIEAVFIFSFRYATEMKFWDHICTIRWPIMILFLWIVMNAVLNNRKDKQCEIFLILNCIIMSIVLNLGNSYIHYYQLLVPSILIGFWMWMEKIEDIKGIWKQKQVIIAGVLMLTSMVYLVPQSGRVVTAVGLNSKVTEGTRLGQFARKLECLDSYGNGMYGYYAKEQVDDILQRIPEDRKKDLYNYSTSLQWLLLSDILPYNKYCIDADHFSCLSPKIANEIEKMFQNNPPQYVVTKTDVFIKNEQVKIRLVNQYKEIYRNTSYCLYEIKR